jgi:hypothetical protein
LILALLGVVFLLANPAGACAGIMAGLSSPPSHPCCPKPSGDLGKSSCICIDRQPAAPTVPPPGELTEAVADAPAQSVALDLPVETIESFAFEDLSPAPHAIILSIHQLLL